ncbi:hypothetical protein ACX9NE_16760 [Mycobacterium sp. ML4]
MTTLAPTFEAFFRLGFDDFDADFMNHLKQQRHNSVRTRNVHLAAILSTLRCAALSHSEQPARSSGYSPPDQTSPAPDRQLPLTNDEIDALLDAPDRSSGHGRRAKALLLLAVQTSLRVSEFNALTLGDLVPGRGVRVRLHGQAARTA